MTLVLADTNVLVRLANPTHEHHGSAKEALSALAKSSAVVCLVPQTCYEYYAVVTRPSENNDLGMTPAAASEAVDRMIRRFRFLRDERGVFDAWAELVEAHAVRGKASHDARMAAAAVRHGVAHVLTFNGSDFERYDKLAVLHPDDAPAFARRH
ncbi:type II toxin-antitoxin system VapC family toxin [Alienimonas californiensis]|uniref:Ribonuclease VapC n=1 Tax=Alienimonas californiensis TaxID=2527989 RepID=A0A517P4G7_9PLAN|nr:type II toxin-antitoxin system VapC family toxin [Alienimonas californiensis]QDT14245.1 tRNA(fMet)-specific endonuclease VapC [Alienimonas californiensis]